MPKAIETAVATHYGRTGLIEAIAEGLKKSGADLKALKPEDLAPVDEFHTAGRAATLKALAKMPLKAGMHVLDAGSGIGGTARCLAREHGCRVTGIDLTPEYVAAARKLTEWMGLSLACSFQIGSVTDMPFPDSSFEGAVTFHVAMNIEDRTKFYTELARVVRSGSPLCVFDVMKGPTAGMVYPVPWAETPATSFLRSREETKTLLGEAGFKIVDEENLREMAMEFFREASAKMQSAGGPPPLGLHLLAGANTREKFTNYVQALNAHQIEPVVLIASRN